MTAAKAYRGVGMEGAIATWYTQLERMVVHSRFGRSEITSDGVGFELRLSKTSGRQR